MPVFSGVAMFSVLSTAGHRGGKPGLSDHTLSYYSMILVKINKGDKISLHVLKNTTEAMIILQTLMGHLSCPLYNKAIPLC